MILDYSQALNQLVIDHKELLTVIAVPLLAYTITVLSQRAASERASKERALEREVAAESRKSERELSRRLKLAEFRQAWIDGLREDLAALAAITVNPAAQGNSDIREANQAYARVVMRLNPLEEGAQLLLSAMNSLNLTKQEDPGELQTAFVRIGQNYLKLEWDALKNELREIDYLERTQ